jgi:bifunctional UDP-N-acetylglucosamine pyrophosphorylase / glucosamine-1-phosphate N-acetyltransferase
LAITVYIGPNVILKDTTLADNVEVKANTIIDGAEVAEDCVVGPFARLRPGTELAAQVKVGNFVEIKKSILGENTKASHLTYLGDATIGTKC